MVVVAVLSVVTMDLAMSRDARWALGLCVEEKIRVLGRD